MRYERRPWLSVVPWCQVRADGGPLTVLPSWPPYVKRVTWPGGPVATFTPGPMDMASVLIPDEADAYAALIASFGMPELLATREAPDLSWSLPGQTPATVGAHLRDWHGTLDLGTTYQRTRSDLDALALHWQLHQQQLVHPIPTPHLHTTQPGG